MPRSLNISLCLLVLSGSLVGCRSGLVERRPVAIPVGGTGSGAELVFAPTDLGELGAQVRADDRMGRRAEARAFDQWAWPTPNRLSLDRVGRISLPSNANSQIYFRESRTDWQRTTSVEGRVWVTP